MGRDVLGWQMWDDSRSHCLNLAWCKIRLARDEYLEGESDDSGRCKLYSGYRSDASFTRAILGIVSSPQRLD